MLSNENEAVRFAIVAPDGDILRIGQCRRRSLYLQVQDGETLKENPPIDATDLSHYWDGESFAEYPIHQPTPWHKWNGSEWVDPRTSGEITTEYTALLQAMRAKAFLPKLEFILRTVAKGYISKASGLSLLAGQIPQELIGLPDLLNEEQVFELQAKLIAASQVDRLDPFIQMVAWYMGLTDADVDLLFDVELPAPIV